MPIRQIMIAILATLLVAGCASRHGVYHPVAEGQTLYRIGLAYGLDAGYLARVNGITDPKQIRPGRRLFIPGASRVQSIPRTPAAAKAPLPRAAAIVPAQPEKPEPPRKPLSIRTTKPPPAPVKGQFAHPIRGNIVKTFGNRAGKINQGIEFAAPFGAPVLAAATGRVIYSGNGIKGYGNLIILRHADSFYTVYGFNSKNLVASGANVDRGEKIALCGNPPGAREARLHFEIRHGKKAVNPIFYLP